MAGIDRGAKDHNYNYVEENQARSVTNIYVFIKIIFHK